MFFENKFRCLLYSLKNIFKIRELNCAINYYMKMNFEAMYIPMMDTGILK